MFKFKPTLTALCAAATVAASLMAAPLAAHAADTRLARVVVQYRAGNSAAVQAAVARLGGRMVVDLDQVNAMAVMLPRGAVAALKAARNVDSVQDDVMRSIQGTRSAKRLHLADSTQVVPYGITMVQADQVRGLPAWRPTVCIVDSGINATHEDLAGNALSGANFTSSGTWDSDENSHGTHVSGTIAALNNDLGVVGVSGRKILKLRISKVFDAAGSSPSSVIAKGMLGCLAGRANVVSMSLGGDSASPIEQKVVDLLTSRGMLLIAAAGNAGDTTISYPAGFESVMSVAAVDDNMDWATFSQYNDDVEIAGPGVDVLSTVPQGSQISTTTTVGANSYDTLQMEGSPLGNVTAPLADFGFGDTPVAGSMTGKVCLISRGNISFGDKVANCEASGGVGAIVFNNTDGPLNGTLGDIVTTIPSVGALQADGATMLTQLGQSATLTIAPNDDKYAYYSGTSMATPHVAAVAGLVWAYYPNCSNEQIRSALKASALDVGDAGYDTKTGYGIVQAKAAFNYLASHSCSVN